MLLYVNLDKKSQNSFINLVGISGDCTAFLSFKSFITFSKGPSEVSVSQKVVVISYTYIGYSDYLPWFIWKNVFNSLYFVGN